MAETGAVIPPSSGVISGTHDGRPYVNEVYLGCTGSAGAPQTDGWLTIIHVGNAGMCYQDSIEMDELRHPIRVDARRLLSDTEGAGRFRGALSAYSEFAPLQDEMVVAYVSDGNSNPPRGTRGGLEGGRSAQFKRLSDGTLIPQPGCAEIVIRPGETMVSISCGGGGYGPPRHREPTRVAKDVAEGWISETRAESVYGIALTADGHVDAARTAALRGSAPVIHDSLRSGVPGEQPAEAV